MAYNKVVYGTTVLVDLTADTIAPETMVKGTTAHDKAGNPITGNLTFNTIRAMNTEPDNSVGIDGDIWLKV